jgi:hypothetical protein
VTLYSVILTVVVLLAVAVLILLFERRRAREIEHDTRDMARHREGGSRR